MGCPHAVPVRGATRRPPRSSDNAGLPENAPRQCVDQVLMRGRDDAHVHLNQFDCRRRAQIGRSAIHVRASLADRRRGRRLHPETTCRRALLESARPFCHGAGKGSLLVSEKFAFQQRRTRAAQFTLMNGLSSRPELRWIAEATSSLPVPLSPRIRIDSDEAATLPIVLKTCTVAAERPTSSSS